MEVADHGGVQILYAIGSCVRSSAADVPLATANCEVRQRLETKLAKRGPLWVGVFFPSSALGFDVASARGLNLASC